MITVGTIVVPFLGTYAAEKGLDIGIGSAWKALRNRFDTKSPAAELYNLIESFVNSQIKYKVVVPKTNRKKPIDFDIIAPVCEFICDSVERAGRIDKDTYKKVEAFLDEHNMCMASIEVLNAELTKRILQNELLRNNLWNDYLVNILNEQYEGKHKLDSIERGVKAIQMELVANKTADEFDPNTRDTLSDGFITSHDYGIYGRTSEINKILSYLQENKAVIVCGEGGIGKTELCREVISRSGRKAFALSLQGIQDYRGLLSKFIGILRIQCDNDMVSQENAIYDKLSLLEKDRWIIYIDNLEELLSENIAKREKDNTERFIRRIKDCSHNNLLISSRYKLSRKNGFRTETIDTLNKNDATDLFCSIWFEDESCSNEQRKEVYSFVVDELYCYPLSIILTASQAVNGITFESMKQKWRRRKSNIKIQYPDNERHASLVTALQYSYQEIKDNPLCCDIWAMFSYFPGKIPEELIIEILKSAGEDIEQIDNGLNNMVMLSIIRREIGNTLKLDGNESESEIIDMLQPLRQVINEIDGIAERKAHAKLLISNWFLNCLLNDKHGEYEGSAESKYLFDHINDLLFFMRKLIEEGDFQMMVEFHKAIFNYYIYSPYESKNIISMALGMSELENAEFTSVKASFHWSLGCLFVYIGKNQEAMDSYKIAEALYKQCKSTLGLANVYLCYGRLYKDLDNLNEANNYIDKAIELYIQADSEIGLFHSYCIKAGILMELGNLNDVDECLSNAEAICVKNHNISNMANIFLMRAEKESINGNKEKEGEFLLRAENGFIQANNENGLADALTQKGDYLRRKGLLVESISCYKNALELSKKTEDIIRTGLILSRLSLANAQVGNTEQARSNICEAREIQKKISFEAYKKAMDYLLMEAELIINPPISE